MAHYQMQQTVVGYVRHLFTRSMNVLIALELSCKKVQLGGVVRRAMRKEKEKIKMGKEKERTKGM